MALLSEKDSMTVRQLFAAQVTQPVKLAVYADGGEGCPTCADTLAIAQELATLSDLVEVEARAGQGAVEGLAVDRMPATLILGQDDQGQEVDYGIRFYGVPSGYEFMSLLDAIQTVGGRGVSLSEETRQFLDQLEEDLHIQVFVTPTCPYCPPAVILAHHLAFASARVRADMVEANEFPELSARYHVMGVPRSVINEHVHQEGAVPEPMLVARLQEALT